MDNRGCKTSPIYIWQNIGANVNITVTATAPATFYSGTTDDVFQLDVRHNGYFPDNNVSVYTLRFKYPGLSATDIVNRFSAHQVYVETNGQAGWQSDDASLIISYSVSNYEVSITTTDLKANISASSTKTFYYVVTLTSNAHTYGGSVTISFVPDGYASSDWNEMNAITSPVSKVATIENATEVSVSFIAVPEFADVMLPIMATVAVIVGLGIRRKEKHDGGKHKNYFARF